MPEYPHKSPAQHYIFNNIQQAASRPTARELMNEGILNINGGA